MKAVTLYRPRALGNVLNEFDNYMNSFFGNDFLSPSERIFNRLPSVDVRETEKAYVLEAELPGYDEKDIEVRLDNNVLTIESKKNENDEKKEEGYLIRERRASSFSRSFRLPENANPEGINASFKNGILRLEMDKQPETGKKVIPISTS